MNNLEKLKLLLADIAIERRKALINVQHWQQQLRHWDEQECITIDTIKKESEAQNVDKLIDSAEKLVEISKKVS